jgi:hypothetical protein
MDEAMKNLHPWIVFTPSQKAGVLRVHKLKHDPRLDLRH